MLFLASTNVSLSLLSPTQKKKTSTYVVVQEPDPVDGTMSISPLGCIPVDGLVGDRAPETAESVRGARQVFERRAPSRDFEEESVVKRGWVGGEVSRILMSALCIGGRQKDKINAIARGIGGRKKARESARAGAAWKLFFFYSSSRARREREGDGTRGKRCCSDARKFQTLVSSPLRSILQLNSTRHAQK